MTMQQINDVLYKRNIELKYWDDFQLLFLKSKITSVKLYVRIHHAKKYMAAYDELLGIMAGKNEYFPRLAA